MKFPMSVQAAALIITGLSGTAMADCDTGEMVIKFSHVTNTDIHPIGIAAKLLQQRVNDEMNGIACVEVFPNSVLYDDDQVLEAILKGDVQLAAPSLSKFEKFTKQFQIFDLPFMFKDIDAVDKFQNSNAGQAMKDSIRPRGLQGLAFWHEGMKQISANTSLIEPKDASELKFYVQPSVVLDAQFEALGASSHKMALGEVYGALQTGIVDGQENTWLNIYARKWFELQDGITESNHGLIGNLVVASSEWWEGLDSAVRDQLANILREVTVVRNFDTFAINEQAKESIYAAGGVIRKLTDEQRALWVEALKPVWEQFGGDVGAELIEVAKKIGES